MALDLGLTTHQLLSTLDGVVSDAHTRGQRLDGVVDRALDIPTDEAAFRTAAVGRRPYISARTVPEGLLGSRPPPELPADWTAISVDGSHIDVDRHLPCAATSSTWAAASSPTGVISAAGCSASPPWPWRTMTCTSALPTMRAVRP